METININLLKYRGKDSSLFTGRPQGEAARKELELDKLDKRDDITIKVLIPAGTTSFNPSFYLGLLFKSIKLLGVDKFDSRFEFVIEEESELIKKVIADDLNDGRRHAINSLPGGTGLSKFLKKG